MRRHRTGPAVAAVLVLMTWTARAEAQYLPDFPAGNGVVGFPAPGNDLMRIWLSAPGVVCNDGTTPAIYVRRAQNIANADNWVIYLEGGGNCGGAEECLQRWTGVDSNYGIQKMSTSVPQALWNTWHPGAPAPQGWVAQGANYVTPPTMGANGILDPVNSPFGAWNRIYANYCSSDNWSGQKLDSELALAAPVGGYASYRVHFRGAAIFDEMVARLRAGITYCRGAQCETLPSLDAASMVLLAGSSAGANGVKQNLDRFRDTMHGIAPSMEVRGVLDAGGAPSTAGLAWPPAGDATSYVQFFTDRWTNSYVLAWDARGDASCVAENTPANHYLCADTTHVLRHHVTSPFLVRMDLQDSNAIDPYQELFFPAPPFGPTVAESRFAGDVTVNLTDLAAQATVFLPRYPAELARVAADPQWMHPVAFGPRCTNHVGLLGPRPFFQQQILSPAGVPTSFADALFAWVNAAPGGLAGAPTPALLAPPGVGPRPFPFCP